jgi:hypothetical protein
MTSIAVSPQCLQTVLKYDIRLNYRQKFSPDLTENGFHLNYKENRIDIV